MKMYPYSEASISAPRYIDPVEELGGLLLNVDKPARYTGGEYGLLARKDASFKTLIAFPDLYEVGMGNQAMRIIYNRMNSLDGVSCDRAFAPAPDFEKLLREKNIPLYGLDTGISLACVDLLMFTLGYELGLNGILTMLDVSGIPLRNADRAGHSSFPLIIAGGPAVSNPAVFSPFIDAFWMGEAEESFFELAAQLSVIKGEGRAVLFEKISSHPNIWVKGKKKTKRAVFRNFENNPIDVYPIPGMKIIQHHGTVEIMRGCPNGCRFCHAGFWYRPCRQKKIDLIISQVRETVTKGGWQEISLSSLSSGDYTGINELIEKLNCHFMDNHVSFQLPSLKISGFSLSLLEKISVTRKSGLTFAIETPLDFWQLSINKNVTRDSVTAILEEAKKSGWKSAKFYFMIGLPVYSQNGSNETQSFNIEDDKEIVSFIKDIGRRCRMHFNINVGIFIPKPHTPFQWAPQIDSITAERKISYIRSNLKPLGHKVSASDSLMSQIEGLLSRGDEIAGLLCEEAWKEGSRLDPWSEYINREKWLDILAANEGYIKSIFSGYDKKDVLPWSNIDSLVKDEYFSNELDKSEASVRTASCREKCGLCGVCGWNISAVNSCEAVSLKKNKAQNNSENYSDIPDKTVTIIPKPKSDPSIYRVLFSFSKEGKAVFHGHLSLIEIFSMSFRRAGINVLYTKGFNPLAKMEFASPLSTGISACEEIATVDFESEISTDKFASDLNKNLPEGIVIKKAECFLIKTGEKKHSLTSLLWGFTYLNGSEMDYVNAKSEKVYRESRINSGCQSLFSLKRTSVLSRNIISDSSEWALYFDVYRHLYNR